MEINQESSEISLIRKILLSEITWVILIVGGVMSFVSQVILPLEKMQIQLANIEQNIEINRQNYNEALKEHNALQSRLDILETKISSSLN